MAEAPKPCEESTPRPPGVIPIHRTSGIPRPRCTKRVVLPPPPPPPPVLAPCPGGQVRKLPRANSPCICPPSLPVFFENRICVATCPPGLGLINRGPNGACACPDNFEQIAVNGKCLPKCNPVTEVRDESGICVPRPPPIDKSKPIYIETGVELGAFEQSIIKVKTDTRVNEQRIKLEINPKSNEVVLKSIDTDEELFKLNGIPYEYIKRRMSGKPLTHMINGMGRVGQTEWPLYIKEVKTGQIRTFGFNQKRGVAIEFYPFDGNHYRVTNGKIVKGEIKYIVDGVSVFPPPPVFIVTDGLTSFIQDGKKVTTMPEVMAEFIRDALMPNPTGGRRNTLKRRNSRTIRGKYKKTKKHRYT